MPNKIKRLEKENRKLKERKEKKNSGLGELKKQKKNNQNNIYSFLTESKEKLDKLYSTLFKSLSDAIYILDKSNLRIVDANPSACRLYGYKIDELRKLKVTDITAEKTKTIDSINKNKLHIPYRLHKKKDGTIFPVELIIGPLKTEGKVYFIAQIHDLTKHLKMEKEVRESLASLKEAQKIAKIGNWHWNLKTGEVIWSDETYNVTGRSKDEKAPHPKKTSAYYTPESLKARDKAIKRCLELGVDTSYEGELIRVNDNEHRWIHTIIKPIKNEKGKIVSLYGTAQDITERKLAEQKLKELNDTLEKRVEERTKELIEKDKELTDTLEYIDLHLNNSPLAIIEFDEEFKIVRWSDEAEKIFGWKKEEVISKGARDFKFIYEEDMESVNKSCAGLMEGTISRSISNNRNYGKDGSVIYCEWYNSATYDSEGKLKSVLSQVLNVTERNEALKALKESEERNRQLSELLESSKQPFGIGFADGKLGYINKAFEAMTGYNGEELRKERWLDTLTPPEWIEFEREKLDELVKTGIPVRYEKEYIKKDGTRVPIELLVHVKKDNEGKPLYYYSFINDLTEKKKAEEKLKESENKYRSLFENMILGVATCEMIFDGDKPNDFVYLDVNEAFGKLTGLKNVVGKKVTELIPGIKEQDDKLFQIYGRVSLSGNPERFEIYLEALKEWFDVSVYSPKKGYFVAIFDVITSRKNAFEELKRTQQEILNEKKRLEVIMETLPVGVAIIDEKGGTISANEHFEKVWGEGRIETSSINDYEKYKGWRIDNGERVKPEEWASAIALSKGESITGQLFKIQKFDGKFAYVNNSAAPLKNEDGKVTGCVVVIQDITEQMMAEEMLKESEEKYRTLYSSMLEGVALHEVIYDKTGMPVDYRVLEVNPSYETIMGIKRDEAVGRFASVVYKTNFAPFLDKYFEVVRTGTPIEFESEFANINKTLRISAFSQEKNKFAVVFSDITERKLAEEKITHYLNELEKKNYELSRFNNAMVGRELRMIELKKEINELCAKIGEPMRYLQEMEK